GGAWESGERAADAVLHRLGPVKQPAQPEAETKPKRKPVRARVERRAPRYEAEPQYGAQPQYYGGTPSIMREER
ncbi:MAG TPA: hypothetical protein VMC05_05555, partial [Xanthobacteraceae bacterium]|nr:hypothetical protein [Xanthobacteraceae bacterium]